MTGNLKAAGASPISHLAASQWLYLDEHDGKFVVSFHGPRGPIIHEGTDEREAQWIFEQAFWSCSMLADEALKYAAELCEMRGSDEGKFLGEEIRKRMGGAEK